MNDYGVAGSVRRYALIVGMLVALASVPTLVVMAIGTASLGQRGPSGTPRLGSGGDPVVVVSPPVGSRPRADAGTVVPPTPAAPVAAAPPVAAPPAPIPVHRVHPARPPEHATAEVVVTPAPTAVPSPTDTPAPTPTATDPEPTGTPGPDPTPPDASPPEESSPDPSPTATPAPTPTCDHGHRGPPESVGGDD